MIVDPQESEVETKVVDLFSSWHIKITYFFVY